jgi:hypothetical protein
MLNQPASRRVMSVGAAVRRGRPREPVWFPAPYRGKTGAELAGYQWVWKVALVEDSQGEARERRISDWEEAVRNPETGREIVHQFFVRRPEAPGEWVSAESAAQLLGVTDGTARAAAKRLLSEEMVRRDRADRIEAAKAAVDGGQWHPTPASAVEALSDRKGLGRLWWERRRWGDAERTLARRYDVPDAQRCEAQRLAWECRQTLWFTRGPKGWVALAEHEDEGRGWEVVRLLASEIWDEHGRDRAARPAAPMARSSPAMS